MAMSMQIDVNVIKDNNAQMKAHDRPEDRSVMTGGWLRDMSPLCHPSLVGKQTLHWIRFDKTDISHQTFKI